MQVKMPQLGETVIEGTILKWLKQEGDDIAQDEPLFEISTDKVDTEVPSPAAGTLTKILVAEGETVPVGTDLATIDAGDEVAGEAAPGAPSQPAAEASESAQAGGASTGGDEAPSAAAPDVRAPVPASAPVETPQVEPAAPDVRAPAAAATQATPPVGRGPRSQILSPLVRKLAAEHDVDLSRVAGTGTGGRITKNNVLSFVAGRGTAAPAAVAGIPEAPPAPPPAPMPPAVAGQGEEIVPITHIRKAIAQHMLGSTTTTARAWTMVEVNVDHLVKLRERAKDAFREKYGVNLTYLPFVVRATTDALLEYPNVNARLDGDNLVVRRYVNMAIAVSYDAGLIVPVIKGADGMNSVGIARAIADLAARARAHQLKPDEVQGGTFTITNPGPYGSVASVPIINTPDTGILSLDAIVKRPVVIDDAIAIRSMVNVSMSWDHRVIDGELATRFLGRIKQNLETWDFAEDLGV
ncbi:MAG: dihydrolipoamide acetyltransferase family protein [Actinomycetota bacterium]